MARDVTKKITAQMILDSTGFNASITGVNRQLRLAKAELQSASTQVGVFGKDSERLKGVQESLAKQVELHSKKVDLYKKSIEETSVKMNDNIRDRDKLKSSLDEANKKYDEAVKLYGKESEEAKKAKEEVDKLTEEYNKKDKAIESNAKSIQYYETEMTKANDQMVRTQDELRKVNEELIKSEDKWLKATEGLQKSSEKLKDVGGKIEGAGDTLLKLSAPMIAAGGASLKFATDFEDGMAKVDTIADTSSKSIDELREEILKVSNDTGMAANEVAEATYQAISASVDTAMATEVVGVAAKAAKAGFTDVTTAVDGLTSVINAYGMEVEEADDLANKFLITQNEGKTSFGELSKSIGGVAPLADAANIEIEELLSSLATTTAQGLDTSESVTALKGAISNIIKPSKKAQEMAELLGVDFSVAALETKGWQGFLTDLRKAMEESDPQFKDISDRMADNAKKMETLSKAGKENTSEYKQLSKAQNDLERGLMTLAEAQDSPISGFAEMFGSVQGLNGVLMLTSDTGIKKYNKSMDEMANNTTLLDESYNKMINTTGERWKRSMNEMRNQSIRFGDALTPVMDSVSASISKATEKLSQMDDEQIENIITTGKWVLGAGAVLKVGGKLVQGIGSTAEGLSKVTGWIGKMTTANDIAKASADGLTGAIGGGTGLTSVMGPAGVAIGITAAVVGGLAYAMHKSGEAAREAGEAGESFVDGIAGWRDGVDGAKSALEGFNMETVISAEKMGELESKINETQQNIIGIAETAAAESREYTEEERKQIEELIGLLAEYTEQKIEAYQKQAEVVAAMATQERDVSLTRAQELIKGAEEARDQTLAIAQSRYADQVGEAEKLYGHLGELDQERYDAMVANAQAEYEKQTDSANKTYGDTLAIIQQKYLDYDTEARSYLEKITDINSQLEKLEDEKNAKIQKLRDSDVGNQRDKSAEIMRIEGQFEKDQKKLLKELTSAYQGAQENNMDAWIGMAADAELYGGDIQKETKSLATGVIDSLDKLPEDSKDIMADTMKGMSKEMEDREPGLFRKAANIADGILRSLRRVFDIQSPSREMRKITEQLFAGADEPMDKAERQLPAKTRRIADKMLAEASLIGGPITTTPSYAYTPLQIAPKKPTVLSRGRDTMQGMGDITQEIHIHAPTPLSPSETARQNLKVSRQLAMEWGR